MIKKHIKLFVLLGLLISIGSALFFMDKRIGELLPKQLRNSYLVSKAVELDNAAGFVLKKQDDTKIGWVTDIHADRFKRRDIASGLMYPRKFDSYLTKVFDDLKNQGINTVIATGDNTNSGDDNYAKVLSQIAREKNMHVIWVKGNHDNDEVMAILGINGSKYYFQDYGETRIIVLDDVENDGGYYGSIDRDQLNWLRDALRTDKQVIVSMHIPIFSEDYNQNIHDIKGGEVAKVGELLERYNELEDILHSSGNVKMVISGHWHVPWHKELNGITYYGQAALTREGFSGSYGVIDLKDYTVKYSFAK